MTEPSLTEALADDLDAAFPDLVRAFQDGLFSGALRMVGNRQDAEEIAQEAFLRAYRALAGYETSRIRELALAGWLWTITANLCRNHHRTRGRRPSVPSAEIEETETGSGPEELALNVSLGEELAGHLGALPFPMRSAVVLRHVVDLDYETIATALDRPIGTVRADVHRGLARLREAMGEEGAA